MSESCVRSWTLAHRVGFRFLFAYLVLFFFPFPQGLVKPYWLGELFAPGWERLVPWFATEVLQIKLPSSSSGSGDSTYEYVRILLMVLIAVVVTVVWSAVEHKRRNYSVLRLWSRIWLRYALALCMLTFGVVKLVMLQFEPPGQGRLAQPIGELSPMAFLWTFMGFSPLYTFFTGLTEVIGGVLLLARRTTMLGALVVAGVMANVVMLNIAYDVCVKLGSMHILLLAVILLAPDMQRLLDFFVLNRPTQPAELTPHWRGMHLVAARLIKFLALGSIAIYLTLDTIEAYSRQSQARDPVPVAPDGWYQVESVKRDGVPVPPAKPEELRWKSLSLRKGKLGLSGLDGSVWRYKVDGDPRYGAVKLLVIDDQGVPVAGAAPIGTLKLDFTGDGKTATLTGHFNGHDVAATLRRRNAADFPLMSRPFRWIIEEPYFR